MLLAQLNIAKMMAPITSPVMQDFVARLDEANREAETASGFVWRLSATDTSGTTDLIFDDETLLVNMSVWRDSESLYEFVYRNDRHRDALRRRRQWFEALREPMVVCWWVPSTAMPTVRDAQERLTILREQGPSAQAFPFRRVIEPQYRPSGGTL